MGRHLAEPEVFRSPLHFVDVEAPLDVILQQVARLHSIVANPVGVVPYGRFSSSVAAKPTISSEAQAL